MNNHNKISILALGGNATSHVGSVIETMDFAFKALEEKSIFPLKVSRKFRNPAFPAGSGPDFVNSAAVIQSQHDPAALLEILHLVESECGRIREKRWGPRTLDIDLIAHGGQVLPNPETFQAWQQLSADRQQQVAPSELILPHPRLQDRAFVLIPMLEVADDWIHPVSGQSVAQMLANLPESQRNEVVPL